MTEDVRRLAERFHAVFQTFSTSQPVPTMSWDEVPFEYKLQLMRTLDELIKAEAIFPGPSLYAGP